MRDPIRMTDTASGTQWSYDAVTSRLFDLEVEDSFFSHRIREVPIWERIRYAVFETAFYKTGVVSRPLDDSTSAWRRFLTVVHGCWNLLSKNPFLANEASRLYWGHERRKKLDDGRWWDIYCDPIHEEEKVSFVHLESPFDQGHRAPAKTDHLYYLDFVHQMGGLTSELPFMDIQLTPREVETVRAIEASLEDEFSVEFDLVPMIERTLTYRKVMLPMFRRMLNRIDPEVAIIVVSYNKHNFIEVCKDIGVPVVELQHGGFGKYDAGYAFPGGRTKDVFPDYLFVFGQFWKESVDFPIPAENVIPIGYPFLERQSRTYRNVESKDSVLFLSQWTIGHDLTKIATEFSYRADECSVTVKLHPGEYSNWEEKYPWLIDAPLTVIDGDEPPLYELFAGSSVQVGVYSTTVYEGLHFGLDTYLLDLPGVSRMRHLIEDGDARLVTDSSELLANLRTEDDTHTVDTEYYFEPDAINNFERALAEIIGSGA